MLNFLKSCEIGETGTVAFGKNHMHCTKEKAVNLNFQVNEGTLRIQAENN